jgi:hypothetical protein
MQWRVCHALAWASSRSARQWQDPVLFFVAFVLHYDARSAAARRADITVKTEETTMTDWNRIVAQLEDRMASEGSHEVAEELATILQRKAYIDFRPQQGYFFSARFEELSNREFIALWAEADDNIHQI